MRSQAGSLDLSLDPPNSKVTLAQQLSPFGAKPLTLFVGHFQGTRAQVTPGDNIRVRLFQKPKMFWMIVSIKRYIFEACCAIDSPETGSATREIFRALHITCTCPLCLFLSREDMFLSQQAEEWFFFCAHSSFLS